MVRDISHRAAFESHGETYTRVLAEQNDNVGAEARAWLFEKQLLRDDAAAAKRDAREEETLAIAKHARVIAIVSAIAAIIAAVATIIGIK